MIVRWKETTESGPIIHAESADGNDYTLCGYALEGSAMRGEGETELKQVTRGKVNCDRCVGIIRFGKKFPARLLAAS